MIKVLINRTDAIGDTILTLPMAQKIKESFKNSKVYFLIGPASKDLFQGNPYVDDFAIYEKGQSKQQRKDFVKELIKEWGIDHYFYVGGDEVPTEVAYQEKVPFRGGIRSRLKSFFYLKHGVRQKRANVESHEVFYNLRLLAPLGIKIDEENFSREIKTPLWIGNAEVEEAQAKLKKDLFEQGAELKEKYVVVHPGMTGHTQNWPPLYYMGLVKKLREAYLEKYTYLISYTQKDRPYILPIKGQESSDIVFWENKWGLRTYMGVIKGATLFVGPSTGPTHIANALGVPVVAIYSPVKIQSQKRWGPYFQEGTKHIFSPNVNCPQEKKCLGNRCPYFDCMGKISLDDVGETIIKGNLL